MAINVSNVNLEIFIYLERAAVERRTVSYEQVFNHLGWPNDPEHRIMLTQHLTAIFMWCKKHNFPHLTVIVVRKSGADQGLPGKGFWDLLYPPSKSSLVNLSDRDTRRALTRALQDRVFDLFELLGPQDEQQRTQEATPQNRTAVCSS